MANSKQEWFEAVPGTVVPPAPPAATYAYWQHRDSGAIVLVLMDAATGHAIHYTEQPLYDPEIRQAHLMDGGPAHWRISYTDAEPDWDDGEWVVVTPPYPGDVA